MNISNAFDPALHAGFFLASCGWFRLSFCAIYSLSFIQKFQTN